jgi:hypothetical protein
MVGIAPQIEIFSSWISWSTSSASKPPAVEHELRADRHLRAHDRVQSSDVEQRRREQRRRLVPARREQRSRHVAAFTRFTNRMPVTCAIVPRCVVMQPFERPVVPDV